MGQNFTYYSLISEKEKMLIRESYGLLANRQIALSATIFTNLFKVCPPIQTYFEKIQRSSQIHMIRHFCKFQLELKWCIRCLNRRDNLREILDKNIKEHAPRFIPEEYYDHLRACFIGGLEKLLPEQCTEEIKTAWNKALYYAFKYMCSEMAQIQEKM